MQADGIPQHCSRGAAAVHSGQQCCQSLYQSPITLLLIKSRERIPLRNAPGALSLCTARYAGLANCLRNALICTYSAVESVLVRLNSKVLRLNFVPFIQCGVQLGCNLHLTRLQLRAATAPRRDFRRVLHKLFSLPFLDGTPNMITN